MANPNPGDSPTWPLDWPLGLRDGWPTLSGAVMPESSEEVDQLFARAREEGHLEAIFAAMEPLHIRIRQAVARFDWDALDGQALGRLWLTAHILEAVAERLGSPARLLYGALLGEGGSVQAFLLGAAYLEASQPLLREMERREALHPIGSMAAAIAVAWRSPLRDRLQVERAIQAVRQAVRRSRSAQRDDVLGQIAFTLQEIDSADPIRVFADALRGELDTIPLAVCRDLANDAEGTRRWHGRGGKHARGAALLKVNTELVTDRPGPIDRPDEELERKELKVEIDAKLRAADEHEARGRTRRAQQIRAEVYHENLGGKARRTPETRRRRIRNRLPRP